jgi:hypothetical protein
MFKRIKQFFESVAYAGLKPSGGKPLAQAEAKKPGRFAPIQKRFEKFLNQDAPSDPFYLSNRTPMQKARIWIIIGIPAAALVAGLGLVMSGYFTPDAPVMAPPGLTDAELAQKMLPDLDKNLNLKSQHDIEVQDVHVISGGSVRLAGLALNKTDHVIDKVDIVFELTDKNGSRQGAVSTQLLNLAANSSIPFQFPIEQQMASFALVREIQVH